jgi:hypothetical protein
VIHKTRRTSMTWSYVSFGLAVLAVLVAFVLLSMGWPYAN